MKCPNCQNEIMDNVKKCNYCNSKITKVIICSKCGAELRADSKICGYCANKVEPNPVVLIKTVPVSEKISEIDRRKNAEYNIVGKTQGLDEKSIKERRKKNNIQGFM